METELLIRIFLACYFSAVALFYAWRLTRGPKLVYLGSKGSRHRLNHNLFRGFRALIWLVCLVRVPFPEIDPWLGVIPGLYQIDGLLASGALLLVIGFGVAVTGHIQLGASWRSGINPNGPEQLVSKGLYARSRNPMMLGVLMAQTGFFMALPSLFSLLCLLLGLSSILSQVSIEESHLARMFPLQYPEYQQQVRRWL